MGPEDTQQTPQTPAPPPPAPAPQTQQPNVTATIPEDQEHAQAPTVLIPEKKTGLAGIVQEFRNAVAGTTTPETYIDPNTGARYVQHPYATPGQQWMRIAGEAIQGAAAGLAHGQGPGGSERAAAAGIEAGANFRQQQFEKQDEAAQQDYQQQRQAKMDRANDQINTAKLVAAQLANTRMKVKGTEDQVDWSEKQQQYFEDPHNGFRLVGTAQNVSDLARIQREDETELLKNHYQNNTYATVPLFNSDGTSAGIAIYAKSPGWGSQLVPQGTKIPIFEPPLKPGDKPTIKMVTPTVPFTNDEHQGYVNLASKQMAEWSNQQGKNDLNAARTQQAKTAAQANTARAGEASANARKADAETKNLNGGGAGGGANIPAQYATEPPVNGVRLNYLNAIPAEDQSIVRSIGTGMTDAKTMLRYSLAREGTPGYRIFHEVTTAYPGFDATRAPIYEATRKAFTSGQESRAINALNAAMMHMGVMYDNADWLTTVPLVGAAERKMGNQRAIDEKDAKTALVDELGKAYKAGALTEQDKKTWSDRINAWGPQETKGNAKSFIKLLNGKLQAYENQWRNGSPPAAVAPIAFMGPAAQHAYKDIMGTAAPDFGAPAQASPQTQPQKFSAVSSDGKWGWNGSAWVPNTGGQH